MRSRFCCEGLETSFRRSDVRPIDLALPLEQLKSGKLIARQLDSMPRSHATPAFPSSRTFG
jgi:hypothetical protein